ncbi:hypothetical protein XCV3901 [Xanthomonas euvesicatoria pv. vesicatoria str. 85-10]|uniref:Uncharacterized protein n=1 Tax=Xanthomonas euvesicatoria pv. vesicatoria (strain 85-10) TaxID=316273 RepID=Q3BNN1_XANE5|nr:hypothetical protein XCV3901 [Xanthomonas euvesicatoria pv. vesicatoria str. 85-10]
MSCSGAAQALVLCFICSGSGKKTGKPRISEGLKGYDQENNTV